MVGTGSLKAAEPKSSMPGGGSPKEIITADKGLFPETGNQGEEIRPIEGGTERGTEFHWIIAGRRMIEDVIDEEGIALGQETTADGMNVHAAATESAIERICPLRRIKKNQLDDDRHHPKVTRHANGQSRRVRKSLPQRETLSITGTTPRLKRDAVRWTRTTRIIIKRVPQIETTVL